jgi:uncharacterized protein (TIGR02453 family)
MLAVMAVRTATFEGFGERALDFYEGLAADNSRTYWQANRDVYEEHVAGPLRALAQALTGEFGPPKIFRPNRDLRFAADKRPYQEFASMLTQGEGGAGLYLSLGADGLLLAGGYYQPARDQLERFRRLQDAPVVAADLDAQLAELEAAGYAMGPGDLLKSAPRGCRRDHPRIELLRRTRLTVSRHLEPGQWLHTGECLAVVTRGWRTVDGWNGWLAAHVGPSHEPARER